MADLLECLLQIKGLRETAGRLTALAGVDPVRWRQQGPGGVPAPVAILGRLAEIELVHGTCLRLMLTAARPALPVVDEDAFGALGRLRSWDLDTALDRFLARRRDNLELLERCTAEDLARVGSHPARRDMTVADLVAVMLATDVEHVGEIRRRLRTT
jgi:hypothetical protein